MKEAMKQIIAEIDALPEGLGGYFSDAFADNLAKVREALAQPEPIQSLQCFHCQVTIETLNDKVMQLLAERTEQEPVAWISPSGALYRTRYHAVANAEQSLTPLYLHPPQRTEPICPECKAEVLYECVACSNNNYPPKPTEQEPAAWIHIDPNKPKVKFLEWKENEHGYRGTWIKKPLYLHPTQRTEQNFCSRCGKRTPDLTHIHTCTPPREGT